MKYVCELCGWRYDELTGDPSRGIPAGTLFADLPQYYSCPLCGSEKEAFTKAGNQTKLQPGVKTDRSFWNDKILG